nr:zinc finger protein AEBP2-like [Salvelinus alpinus]
MLLKEQKAKFSFLPSDEDEEEDRKDERQREKVAAAGEGGAGKGGAAGEGRSNKQREQDGEKDRRRRQGGDGGGQQRRKGERDRDGRRGRKQRTGGEGRKSPTVVAQATPSSSSTFSPRVPTTDDHTSLHGTGPLQEETAQPEPIDPRTRQGAQTPPYNGKSQSSPHSSGEDMEISDEDEEHTITAVTTHHATPSSVSSPSSSQAPLPSQTDPSASPTDPTQHFGTSMPAAGPSLLPPCTLLPPAVFPAASVHPQLMPSHHAGPAIGKAPLPPSPWQGCPPPMPTHV